MNGEAPVTMQPSNSTHPLRIAMVSETYLPEINGVAITMGRLVDGLRQRRHVIQLIRPRQYRDEVPTRACFFEEVLHGGIAIPRYEALKIGLPAGRKLLRLWTLKRPDIVHIVTEGPLGWSALKAARELQIPVTSDFHTNFHTYCKHYGVSWLQRPITGYLRGLHNKAHCTIVPTVGIRRELELLGFENLRVVGRGVDTALFNPSKRSKALRCRWGVRAEGPVVLYVGRLAAEKNLPLVLRTFEAILDANPKAQLVLVGDGPVRAQFEAHYPQYVFAGMRTGEDLAAHYASADIFLFPSVTETYGNVTMEAMASGLAVIAYDYAAAAEHVRHDHNGLLAPLDESEEFIRLALDLAVDHKRIARIGANARTTTEQIDWSRIVEDFEQTLRSVAASYSGSFEPIAA